jgi:hypothetical protein
MVVGLALSVALGAMNTIALEWILVGTITDAATDATTATAPGKKHSTPFSKQ